MRGASSWTKFCPLFLFTGRHSDILRLPCFVCVLVFCMLPSTRLLHLPGLERMTQRGHLRGDCIIPFLYYFIKKKSDKRGTPVWTVRYEWCHWFTWHLLGCVREWGAGGASLGLCNVKEALAKSLSWVISSVCLCLWVTTNLNLEIQTDGEKKKPYCDWLLLCLSSLSWIFFFSTSASR